MIWWQRIHCRWVRVSGPRAVWSHLPHVAIGIACAVSGGVGLGLVLPEHPDEAPAVVRQRPLVGPDTSVPYLFFIPVVPSAPAFQPTLIPVAPRYVLPTERQTERLPVPEPRSIAVYCAGLVALAVARLIRRARA